MPFEVQTWHSFATSSSTVPQGGNACAASTQRSSRARLSTIGYPLTLTGSASSQIPKLESRTASWSFSASLTTRYCCPTHGWGLRLGGTTVSIRSPARAQPSKYQRVQRRLLNSSPNDAQRR